MQSVCDPVTLSCISQTDPESLTRVEEKKTRRRRRREEANSSNHKARVFSFLFVPRMLPKHNQGGVGKGRWGGASSSRRSKQVACAFRSSHEFGTKERKQKKRKEMRERFSTHITYPGRTLSQEELFKEHQPRNPGEATRTKREKRAAFRAVCNTKQERRMGRLR